MTTPPRPPSINLQNMQNRPPGQILVRNESGQYQLVRMASMPSNIFNPPMQSTSSPMQLTSVAASSSGAIQPTRPVYIRTALVQPVKVGQNQHIVVQNNQAPTGQNQQFMVHNIQSSAPATSHQVSGLNQQPLVIVTTSQMTPMPNIPSSSGVSESSSNMIHNKMLAQQAYERSKQKCRDFLANLLELSQKEYKTTETKVRMLVQALINSQIEPEAFCTTLEQILQATPQPSLIGFLKKSLPPLRQALLANELQIEGIQPPFVDSPSRLLPVPPNQSPVLNPPNQHPQMQFQQPQPQQPPGVLQRAPSQVQLSLRQVRPPSPQLMYSSTTSQIQPPLLHKPQPPPIVMNQPFVPRTSTPLNIQYVRPQKTESPSVGGQPWNERSRKSTAASSSIPSTSLGIDKTPNDDDLNDVAAMGGIDLAEEYKKVLNSTENIGVEIKSCKDEYFAELIPLHAKICKTASLHGLGEPQQDVTRLTSHAVQLYLKTYIEKLACIAEHRNFKQFQSSHVVSQNVKGQLKFLEDIDKVETQRQKEAEREVLLKAVRSKSKLDNLEQKSLKEKGKELQRMEMEEIRLKDANLTALQAIGIKRKANSEQPSTSGVSSVKRPSPPKPVRVKRVNHRDFLFLLEGEKETRRSTFLYKCYLKHSSK